MADDNKYASVLNKTACYSAISFSFLLAKETGLFDALIKSSKPLTSEEIGKITNIKERYAREILGTLTALELVALGTNKEDINVYHLEPAAKEALKGNEFAMAEMNYLRLYMSRYDDVKENIAADKSGMVRYDHSFLNCVDEHKKKLAPKIIDCLLTKVPDLKEKLEKGIDCLEYGCGNAHHFSVLASRFPNSNFTATEVSLDLIEPIKKRYCGIDNLKFDVVDLNNISNSHYNKYDWVYVVDVIHDLPHPGEALKEIKKSLKEPDGIFTFVDKAGSGSEQKNVGNILAAFNCSSSTFLCLPESFQMEDSEAYGASIGKDTLIDFAKAAGFDTTVIMIGKRDGIYISKLH